MGGVLDVIIPTFNNPEYLNPCIISMLNARFTENFGRIIIVNNGSQPVKSEFREVDGLLVLEPGKNLGWENGLKMGLEHSDSSFVCFQNDDVLIPNASYLFYHNLLQFFRHPLVAAVGPTSTVVAGIQSVYHLRSPVCPMEVPFLIFFCVVLRRSHYDAIGGVDDSLPGGDDLDLSIRFRKDGKKLVVNPKSFIIHHGFKTGERVNGGRDAPYGWNSTEMTESINNALIKKHGFKVFCEIFTITPKPFGNTSFLTMEDDLEGDVVREMVDGHKDILELGCGFKKTVPGAVGVDRIPSGEEIPHLRGGKSVADVVCDVESQSLPFKNESFDVVIGRHILEHCVDVVSTLKKWAVVLRPGGRLILAVPDEEQIKSIPTNPEHVHAFTRDSLKNLSELCGFKEIGSKLSKNGISFVSCFEKI